MWVWSCDYFGLQEEPFDGDITSKDEDSEDESIEDEDHDGISKLFENPGTGEENMQDTITEAKAVGESK